MIKLDISLDDKLHFKGEEYFTLDVTNQLQTKEGIISTPSTLVNDGLCEVQLRTKDKAFKSFGSSFRAWNFVLLVA